MSDRNDKAVWERAREIFEAEKPKDRNWILAAITRESIGQTTRLALSAVEKNAYYDRALEQIRLEHADRT